MSRPRTPATTSDTFSDSGSLSDLESGWTDLSSNRSGGYVHAFSMNGDVSDGEDLLFEEYTWEGILHGDNDGDERSEGEPIALPVPNPISSCPSPPHRSVSKLDLNDISPRLVPSGVPIDTDLSSYCSIRASQTTLRLSFPDPLSDSREDILPTHVVHSKHEGAEHHVEVDDLGHLAGSFNSSEGITSKITDSSSFVLGDPSPRCAVIFLGYNPLRSLKSSLLDFLLNAIVTSLEGFPVPSNDLQFSRTLRVAFTRKTSSVQPGSDSGVNLDYIFISDRTTTSDMKYIFRDDLTVLSQHPIETLACPTLAVVFLQPPNRCPPLSNLPHKVKYLPVLLHSLGNDSISSLLDLSPSILFDSTQLSIPLPGNSRHLEALQQCQELGISESRIDGATADILTVEQLTVSSPQHLSDKLKVFFTENHGITTSPECTEGKVVTGLSQKLVIILVAILCSTTLLLSNIMKSARPVSTYSDDYISVQGKSKSSSSILCPVSTIFLESTHAMHVAIATNMAKALGVSVIGYETKSLNAYPAVDSTTVCMPRISFTSARGSPPTLESSPPILTLDPPAIKTLTLTPGKSVIRTLAVSAESISRQSNTLTIRLTTAVSPFVDVICRDLQDLFDAIDALLRAVRELQGEALHSFSGFVDVIKEQANRGIQDFSSKVSNIAHSFGELAFYRHARAQNGARKVKAAGERYITSAKKRFRARWKRARGNAGKALKEGLFARNIMWNMPENHDSVDDKRKVSRQRQNQMREESKTWRRPFYV
ncbi:hypothetical protein Clacol_002840 [Clathrus columnatus]|uniref:Uncharacterized protein n=1 Tax=Clathrus columnatus TaxID=1419009 RepID=A0AAV5A6I7_9AGAM|nr:hypothetical protein Clacol_002840 [Clathrus columnatus]